MTSKIEKGLFSVSYELIVTLNNGKTGTTYHETLLQAQRTEVVIYQKQIIDDLRLALIELQKANNDVKIDQVIFFSKLEEFIRDAKDFGIGALTYQMSYHLVPLLIKFAGRSEIIKTALLDIANLNRKTISLFGEHKINNPEPTDQEKDERRTPLFTWD